MTPETFTPPVVATDGSTDPTAPLAPPRTGFSIVVCYDLIPLLYPSAMATMRT